MKKLISCLLIAISSVGTLYSQCSTESYAVISEVHYDNSLSLEDGDINGVEFIEILAPNGMIDGVWNLKTMNGNGELWREKSIYPENAIPGTYGMTFYTVIFPDTFYQDFGFTFAGLNSTNGIGFMLEDQNDQVIEFISFGNIIEYEGYTSTPILDMNNNYIIETNTTAVNHSLQQNGFNDWDEPLPDNMGVENPANVNRINTGEKVYWQGATGDWNRPLSENPVAWGGEHVNSLNDHNLGIYQNTEVYIPSGHVTIQMTNEQNICRETGPVPKFDTYCKWVDVATPATLTVSSNAEFKTIEAISNQGVINVIGSMTSDSIINNFSEMNLTNATITSQHFTNANELNIGDSEPATAIVDSEIMLDNGSYIAMKLEGINGPGHPSGHSQLTVNDIVLNGKLTVISDSGYAPSEYLPQPIIVCNGELNGTFDELDLPEGFKIQYDYDNDEVLLVKLNIPGALCDNAESLDVGFYNCNPQNITLINGVGSQTTNCTDNETYSRWYNFDLSSKEFVNVQAIGAAANVNISIFSGSCGDLVSHGCDVIQFSDSLEIGNYKMLLTSATPTFDICITLANNTNGIGNVGIKEINPQATLDVNGGIKIDFEDADVPGIIRYSSVGFEGNHEGVWQPLEADNLGNHQATDPLNMNSNRIISLANPINNNDAANKNYVDNHVDSDHDATNEFQQLSISGNSLLISNGNSVNLPNFWSTLFNVPAGFADNIDNVDDGDSNPNNELNSAFILNDLKLELSDNGGTLSCDLGTLPNIWDANGDDELYTMTHVGVGTDTPLAELDLRGTTHIQRTSTNGTNPHMNIVQEGNGYARLKFGNSNAAGHHWLIATKSESVASNSRFNIYDGAAGSNRLVIDGDGAIGINSNAPDARLTVQSESGEDPLRVRVDGSTRMRVHSNGGLSIGTSATPPSNGMLSVGDVIPNSHKGADLGADGTAWNDIYYDDLHNQGAASFTDRKVSDEIVLYPPISKSKGSFDDITERGLAELDPKSLPPTLSDENSLLTDEISTYNYKANYEQQILINALELKNKQLENELKIIKAQLETLSKYIIESK